MLLMTLIQPISNAMQYTQSDRTYILRIEKGEDVLETLTLFCERNKIANAHFRGIGAVKGLTCGYYALEEKKYYFTDYDDLIEVVSLTGNVMLKERKPFIHVHGVFTDTQNVAFGGHIKEMKAGVVVEVILEVLSSKIERLHDEEIGLFLMSCDERF